MVLLLVQTVGSTEKMQTTLLLLFGFCIGWMSTTIARSVYPLPKRWQEHEEHGQALCGSRFFAVHRSQEDTRRMTHILTWLAGSHIIQGIIVGGVLAFLTANLTMNAVVKAMTTTVNGWSTTTRCGQPGNGILLRAACARTLPAVNVVQEAAYWTTTVDSAGRRLSGQHAYVLHFPAGHLPPNEAFWSLTMTDVVGYMVRNPIDRASVGSRSGLVPNADGSLDIYLQRTAPV